MTERALSALKRSIVKWQRVVKTGRRGRCPLCQHFNPSYGRSQTLECADECPVKAATGASQCRETPFWLFEAARSPKKRRAWARAELAFLKALLP